MDGPGEEIDSNCNGTGWEAVIPVVYVHQTALINSSGGCRPGLSQTGYLMRVKPPAADLCSGGESATPRFWWRKSLAWIRCNGGKKAKKPEPTKG